MGGICYEKAVICPAGLGHGAQMLTNGFDLDAALADLDAKWTAARAKLGIQ